MNPQTRDSVWSIGSAAAIVIGSLGPWATFGPFSVSGTSADGVITLILGVLALALIMADRWAWVLVAAAVIAALVGVIDTIDVSGGNGLIDPSPGWGVILVALAGISLTVWSVRHARANRRARRSAAGVSAPTTDVAPARVDRP
jgi:lysylphosphatidylglycerol synthetase-like protein (DUF2156 family)